MLALRDFPRINSPHRGSAGTQHGSHSTALPLCRQREGGESWSEGAGVGPTGHRGVVGSRSLAAGLIGECGSLTGLSQAYIIR